MANLGANSTNLFFFQALSINTPKIEKEVKKDKVIFFISTIRAHLINIELIFRHIFLKERRNMSHPFAKK